MPVEATPLALEKMGRVGAVIHPLSSPYFYRRCWKKKRKKIVLGFFFSFQQRSPFSGNSFNSQFLPSSLLVLSSLCLLFYKPIFF